MAWYMGRTQEMLRKKCLMTSALLSSTVSVLTLATDSTEPPLLSHSAQTLALKARYRGWGTAGRPVQGKGFEPPRWQQGLRGHTGPGKQPSELCGAGGPSCPGQSELPSRGCTLPTFSTAAPQGWLAQATLNRCIIDNL